MNLTLHSLTFINPEGTVGDVESSNFSWMETSSQKPYIAIVMTMGNTDQDDNLFIAEENVFPMYSLHSDVLERLQCKSNCICH